MTCRSEVCKYEFCWMCMGPWEPHGNSWYSCNRFDESDSKDAREKAAVCSFLFNVKYQRMRARRWHLFIKGAFVTYGPSFLQQSRQSLERYLFYFKRYANHSNSLKLEANLFEKVKKMMNEMQVCLMFIADNV